MRVVIPRKKAKADSQPNPHKVAPIPFIKPEKEEVEKGDSQTFKLRTQPNDPDSAQYSLSVTKFTSGTPEEFLALREDLEQVFNGQNVTTGPPKYSVARQILKGDAKATFDKAAATHGNETNEHFESCLDDLGTHIFPSKALSKQKAYMRRKCRKTSEMTIRSYISRLTELNSLLAEFPPYGENQSLDEDEIKEIVHEAIPPTWRNNLTNLGFSIEENDIDDFQKMCERFEETEPVNTDSKEKKNGNGNNTKKSQDQKSGDSNYCMFHGKDKGHSTEQCKVVKELVKKDKFKRNGTSTSEVNSNYKKAYKNFNEAHAMMMKSKGKRQKETINLCESDHEDSKPKASKRAKVPPPEDLSPSDMELWDTLSVESDDSDE